MDSPLVLGEHLGFLLRRAQQIHAALWAEVVSPEVTSAQFGILNQLAAEPRIDQRTLGARLQVDRSTTAELVRRLTVRGLVRHERDPNDLRRKVLRLTEEGHRALMVLTPRAVDVNRQLGAGLSDGQVAELRRMLTVLVESPIAQDVLDRRLPGRVGAMGGSRTFE